MTILYDKRARILLDVSTGERFQYDGGPGGFRITFTVKLTAKSSKNELMAEVYNLRPDDRARFVKGSTIILQAGYVGLIGEVFNGQILHASAERNAADFVLSVDAADGQRATSTSTAALSFKPGTSAKDQINTLLASLKGDKGFKAQIKEKLANARGRSAFGLITSELSNLLKPQGLEWSFQGGVLQITEKNTPTNEPAILLGVRSGLLSAQTLEGGRARLLCRIQPGLVPRRAVTLDTSGLDGATPQPGAYVIDKGTFTGDTHSASWTADVEVSPV